MKLAAALGAAVVLLAAGCSLSRTSTHTITQTTTVVQTVTAPSTTTAEAADCTGADLSASFVVQPGSAGAGNIVYTLKLTNAGQSACVLSGPPSLQLFDKAGNTLPTHASKVADATFPSTVLQTGESIAYDARFSPDVNGTGDHSPGACQPTAATLRVTPPGGGSSDAAVSPPTAVCEQGSISLRPSTS